ncbi:16S rRNA (guanine(527)-N(7))-methyltransferase RsmG [Azohydromonas sp.]|uniref:16S rRNA (guanine(527)-N(7))-methyltransferase RsmG n=1 Tax=Azohydromonas sp. TaxID=1872666 RepID=UPI002D12996C|nr:16S rRNA (guanine(527)-N(7))-methyltransferase RsmG [Azohydromonas sp.]HMM85479.1 16S rRNA (guanine(527)-N(7))-methyltransferase RsmG [Azohydromonas sp.]
MHATLDAAGVSAVADAIGIGATSRQVDALVAFGQLLLRWNRTYNLTAHRDPDQVLTHHLADCLAAVPPLQRHLAAAGVPEPTLLDVGSGGGLPGLVWALMLPALRVHCVDAVGKKAAFVRQAAGELGLPNLVASHARVEHVDGRYDLVASRAFATLADFVTLTRDRLAPAGVWIAMKGREPSDEIAALPEDVEVFHVEPLSVPGLGADRCLVWLRRR